nr:hypothetical protein [Tanacetum cinerariifolium]
AIGLAAGVVAGAIYLLSLHPQVVPVAWQGYLPRWEQARTTSAPQQATLANAPLSSTLSTPAAPVEEASENEEKVEMPTVVLKTVPVAAATPAVVAPAPIAA